MTTIITRDSILRRLPGNLNRKQALYLDGIRHAVEIASLAYNRLQQTLTQIALADLSEDYIVSRYTAAFLDAWCLVDAIDRFRSLWSSLPNSNYRAPEPGAKSFSELAQPIRNVRNVADHLAQRADYVVAQNGSALGVLSWFTATRQDGLEGVICTIVPGTLLTGMKTTIVNPVGHQIELPTGLIHLSAGEYRACLSDVIPEIATRIRQLESGFEQALRDLATEPSQAGADLLLKLNISFKPTVGSNLSS